jgi:hypothetical protein
MAQVIGRRAAALGISAFVLAGSRSNAAQTSIWIDKIPPSHPGGENTWGEIGGGSLVPADIQATVLVVLYSFASGTYWIQPWANAPFTELTATGRFHQRIHLGTRYAAILVANNGVQLPARSSSWPAPGRDILAFCEVTA